MNDIWQKWEEHYSSRGISPTRICRDGILNREQFGKDHNRLLFVMREVNNWEGGNLENLLKDGPKYQMWHTISRWAAGILKSFPDYDSINNYQAMRDALSQVASINLKKTSGQSYSDEAQINAYAFQDRQFLVSQIEEINPTLVIACGTFNQLIWLLQLKVDPDSPCSRPVLDNMRRFWVVPWRHPSRADNRKTYYALKTILTKAK